jgi:hypothetical protein
MLVSPTTTTTYYVVVTACGVSVTSNAATVTVCNTPVITGQPQNASINSGNSTTLSVSATGTNATYQWYLGAPGSGNTIIGQTASSVTVSPTSTTTYHVVVTACGVPVTSNAATVTVCTPPSISAQPQSIAINSGASTTLSVTAAGTSVTYQWFQGSPGSGSSLPGQTAASLTVSPTSTTSYYVVVTACGVSTTSNAATVTVCTTPAITGQPQSASINSGDTATLSVTATGTNVSYQWFLGSPGTGTAIGGETSSSITVSPGATTSYYVVVTACGTSVTSTAATVTVCATPVISAQPQSTTILSGTNATLSVTATGTGIAYQWFSGTPGSGSKLGGKTSSSLTVSPSSTTTYYVVVTACGVSVNSTAATVTVQPSCTNASITSQPQGATITAGNSATLSVTATGTNLTYQWYQGSPGSGTPINGATASSVTVTPGATTTYYVVVTACNTPVTGSAATVTVTAVCNTPSITTQPQSKNIVAGTATTLSVTATGTNLTYQWYDSSGTPLAGQTASSVTVGPTTTTGYYVVVSACGTDVTSATATVTVCNPPVITSQPQSTSIVTGSSATLTVAATGTSVAYQWYRGSPGSGVALNGQTSASLTVSPTTTTTYYVIVTACGAPVTSSAATVTVGSCISPTISAQPQSRTVVSGNSTTLSVTASGTGLTYQWYIGSSGDFSRPVSGGTSSTLTVTPSMTTTYWVRVGGTCGFVYSVTATVRIPSYWALLDRPVPLPSAGFCTMCARPAVLRAL